MTCQYEHRCKRCEKSWHNTQRIQSCPECGSNDINTKGAVAIYLINKDNANDIIEFITGLTPWIAKLPVKTIVTLSY